MTTYSAYLCIIRPRRHRPRPGRRPWPGGQGQPAGCQPPPRLAVGGCLNVQCCAEPEPKRPCGSGRTRAHVTPIKPRGPAANTASSGILTLLRSFRVWAYYNIPGISLVYISALRHTASSWAIPGPCSEFLPVGPHGNLRTFPWAMPVTKHQTFPM